MNADSTNEWRARQAKMNAGASAGRGRLSHLNEIRNQVARDRQKYSPN